MTKKRDDRLNRIITLLSEHKKLDVATLSEILKVSQVTIRKDLDNLEAKSFIQRVHGYAQLNNSDNLSSRLTYHYEEKRKIARKAASLIHDGDTIMIESGSCCALLADELAQSHNQLTIITNSAFIADYIRSHKNIQIILLGGIYQHDSQCLVGPMIRDAIALFHVKYFFIGTDGYSEKTGFTNKDPLRAQASMDMASNCDQVIVLTESVKFKQASTSPMDFKDTPVTVITDEDISSEMIDSLKKQSIELIIAD